MLFVVILLCQQAFSVTVVYPSNGSDGELLAAKEVRRYIYLRTDQLLTVQGVTSLPGSGDLILVCDEDDPLLTGLSLGDSTGTNGFIIKTINSGGRDILVITGNDSTATLHAAYRYAEHLGVGFDLAEDAIPDAKITLDITGLNEKGMGRMFGVRMIISHSYPRLQSWV
jgi:alpha-glucuronidase